MKNTTHIFSIVFLIAIITFFYSCDSSDLEAPKTGKKYFTLSADPDTLPVSGGSFVVSLNADWTGDDPGYFNLGIVRKVDGCYSYTALSQEIHKTIIYTHSINTSDFTAGCNFPNDLYEVWSVWADTIIKIPLVWGHGVTPTTRTAHIEVSRMNSDTGNGFNFALQTVENSFNNLNTDSNLVYVQPSYSTTHITPLIDFNYSSQDSLIIALDDYSWGVRQDSINYPYHYIFAHNQSFDDHILAISYNKDLTPGFHDWSFIFRSRIDDIFSSSNFYKYSIYGQVSVHELLHQIGNAFEPDSSVYSDHLYHTGIFKNRCALNSPDTFQLGDFKKLTSFYRVCDRHITKLRSPFGGDLISAAKDENTILPLKKSGISEDVNNLKMELTKASYKEFEPVLAEFTFTNNSTDAINIFDLFDENFKEAHICITDNLGNKWSSNKNPLDLTVIHLNPKYTIKPGESLEISMPINNWGEKSQVRSKKDNDWYFSNFGYFPAGRKYVAYFYFNDEDASKYKINQKTNEVNFEVTKIEDQDREILTLHKQGKQEEALLKFPDNVYNEYILANSLVYKYWGKTELILLNSDYNQFFEKYPNSLYLLNSRFLTPYIEFLKKNNISKSEATSTTNNELLKLGLNWNY